MPSSLGPAQHSLPSQLIPSQLTHSRQYHSQHQSQHHSVEKGKAGKRQSWRGWRSYSESGKRDRLVRRMRTVFSETWWPLCSKSYPHIRILRPNKKFTNCFLKWKHIKHSKTQSCKKKKKKKDFDEMYIINIYYSKKKWGRGFMLSIQKYRKRTGT